MREKKYETTREELQEILSSIPCGLCVYKFEKERLSPVFHNPAFLEMLGYNEGGFVLIEQRENYLGVHPEDLPEFKRKVRDTLHNHRKLKHTCRMWNEKQQVYLWIHTEGTIKIQKNGSLFLYSVFTDVSEQRRLESELLAENERKQDIINAIPGGVAIYKMSDTLEIIYFSDGVAELAGYSVEDYSELIRHTPEKASYWEDTDQVSAKVREIIQTRGINTFEYRKQHKDGHIVWVRAQIRWMGETEGCPLIHCVFHNITERKEAELEREHMLNSIPGGIASYRIEEGVLVPIYFSAGVLALSGHTKEEFWEITRKDACAIIHDSDKERVASALKSVLNDGGVLDISYRIRHKKGSLIWVHLNGQCMGPVGEGMRFYAVFTGMSAEARLFQSIADEIANGIYVIDKENYDLLYVSETVKLFPGESASIGQKCYATLHGKSEPCEFCTFNSHEPDGEVHEMLVPGTDKFYNTRFRPMNWNGIPAYVKYVQDTTEDVLNRKEKQRLEEYFQTVVENLPGGIAVIRYEQDGTMIPEYMSDSFAEMVEMSAEEAWDMYRKDATVGIHPDDKDSVMAEMSAFIRSGEGHCNVAYRLKKGGGSYIWVRNILSAIQSKGGARRVYASFQDITADKEEQERLLCQYNEKIIEHYHMRGADTLIAGNCNITQDRIVEMVDHTDSGLLEMFGSRRDDFFNGVASLIVDEAEQQAFRDMYLNAPAQEAFKRGETEKTLNAFVKMPKESHGRYLQFIVNMMESPDTNDITGILTVTDITEETISSRILQHLSVVSYDLVEDVNIETNYYKILTGHNSGDLPEQEGSYSERIAWMLDKKILPKDKARVAKMLDRYYMFERLGKEGAYSFPYTVMSEEGEVLTKNMTVSASDMRLGRVCLARTDITESIQEQQRLLNIIAYTFEVLAFVDIEANRMILYTRKAVLENLPPYTVENYSNALKEIASEYDPKGNKEIVMEHFRVETLLNNLEKSPGGYDFVLPYHSDSSLRYKQVNVLWGERKRTVCMVRADVTDMLAAERKAKDAMEKALELAEEANLAKSDFLSSMSHDIRTPMNAITGLTMLAMEHLDERTQVEGYLKKVVLSSKHLLSLINDILDMNKIERSKITLSRVPISIAELTDQLSDMIALQAKESGVEFRLHVKEISHWHFYGDSLRVNQILLNILSNAVKFTPEGGSVEFTIKEMKAKHETAYARYLFQISDSGIGMSEEFFAHIFEPFTRGRNVTKVEGSGLGLSIVKGLVDLMEGDITVSSQVHQGTTFRIELEFEAAQENAEFSNEISSQFLDGEALKGRCFLLAEDNAINAEILCELLQMYGVRVVVKTDGIQTVQEYQRAEPGTYDAILMDIQMPYMNGYDAARQIRKLDSEDAENIPIIAMTANAFEEDVQEALAAGMDAHIAKPIDIPTLLSTLGKVLRNTGRENEEDRFCVDGEKEKTDLL